MSLVTNWPSLAHSSLFDKTGIPVHTCLGVEDDTRLFLKISSSSEETRAEQRNECYQQAGEKEPRACDFQEPSWLVPLKPDCRVWPVQHKYEALTISANSNIILGPFCNSMSS